MKLTNQACTKPIQVSSILHEFEKYNLLVSQNLLSTTLQKEALKITTDSRDLDLLENACFLAYRGFSQDAHHYLKRATSRARLLIFEDPAYAKHLKDSPYLIVSDARKAWSVLTAASFNHPHHKLTIIGITGTNGKSSTVWMLKEIFKSLGVAYLSIGTLGAYFPDEKISLEHTSPDPPILFYLLSEAYRKRIKYVFVEVSSIGLAQQKFTPIEFSACAFTSFSRDHLDFHDSMDDYLSQKLRLCNELLAPGQKAFIHETLFGLDQFFVDSSRIMHCYGRSAKATAKTNAIKEWSAYKTLSSQPGKVTFELFDHTGAVRRFNLQSLDSFAIDNFVAALCLADQVLNTSIASEQLKSFDQIPGRLEIVDPQTSETRPVVIVDYAHTPDALFSVLQTLRPLCKSKLWLVFGCGGDRDKGKRPLMLTQAMKFADRIIVTSDNPRNESPETIIQEILAGRSPDYKGKIETQIDRAQAIEKAIRSASTSDIVLIAGKGHETYMIIDSQTLAFDDRLEACRALRSEKERF